MPDVPAFGGGATSSLISPAALVLLGLFAVLVVALPRKWVIAPLLLGNFLIPIDQQVYLFGVHWFPARIIVLIACARLLATKAPEDELERKAGLGPIDW